MNTRILNGWFLKRAALIGVLVSSVGYTSAADYAATLTGLNPVAHWRLNEPAQPVVPTYPLTNTSTAGTALNGLYYGVPTLQAPGAVAANPAASFSGNLQYTETPYNALLNPSGPFTVEFWANLTNDSAGAKSGVVSRYITQPGGPTGQFGYLFFVNNGNTSWQFRVYNGTNSTGQTVTDANISDVQPDTWYHVVGVYDGANIHIYLNGLPTSTSSGIVYCAPSTNAPTRIGAGTPETAPSLFFPGQLDNVAIYHTALPADKIVAHYEAATTNAAGYNAQILADNPAVYYPMNEPSLPPYVPYPAVNSGTLGSALDGVYSLASSSSGVPGPGNDQFAGFAADNKSVRLNASGTAGRVTFPPVTGMTTDHVTLTCWVRRAAGTQVDTAPMFFHEAPGGGAASLNFQYATRNLAYHWESGSKWAWTSGLLAPDDIWTFVALVVTPTNGIMYMGSTNGLTSRTNTAAHDVHDFSQTWGVMGAQLSRSDRYLKGWLDEVALFDQALDYNVISNLFYSATPAIPLVTRTADPLYEGMTVTFTAYGVAAGPANYQWRKGGSDLPGKTSSVLSLNNVVAGDSGNYDVVVTYGANSVTSAVSAITIGQGPPVVLSQSPALTRYAGARATFTVDAGGSAPLTFQWQKNSTDIPGETSSSYTIPAITDGDAANYRVKLVNPYGTNFSAQTALTVLPVSNYAAAVMASQPMAYWRLNEASGPTAFDYAGGNHGTNTGPVVVGTAGPRPPTQAGFAADNNAFTLEGSTAWVTGPALNWNTNTMTFTAWIKVAAYHPTDLAGIVFARGPGGAAGLHMISSGELRYHWSSGGHYSFASGLTPPIGQWVFVALVIEPSRATLYMNDGSGLVSAVNNDTHDVVSGSDPLYLGRDRTDRVFNGDIDEAAVFQRALSADEIQNLSLMGVSGPTPPAIVSQPKPQYAIAGQDAAFAVGVIGGQPITYQWKRDGANLPGATAKTLNLTDVYYTDAGSYSVGITNAQGGTNSQTATLTVAAVPTFANLTNGLVLHLKFDDDVQDASGRANHGTIYGETNFVTGKLGKGLRYRTDATLGVYNYVSLGTPGALQFGATTNFSVAYWVKFTGLPGDLPFLGSGANSYGSFGLTFAPSWEAGGWSYYLGGDTGSAGLYGPGNSINDGTWHSLVHTFDRTGDAVTYLDGVPVDARSIANVGNVDSGLPFNIGQDPTGSYGVSAQGEIDDLGVWQRALNPIEAQAIYLVGQNQSRSFDTYGPVLITLQREGSELEIIWQAGTLEAADNVGGPYNPVLGAAAPYHKVATNGEKKFYRIRL